MAKAPVNGLPLAIPKEWALSTLMLHFEGEDFTDDERPFAAAAMVQARLDIPSGTAPGDVQAKDLSTVRRELAGFALVDQGNVKLADKDARFLEFSYAESSGRRLQQLTYYIGSKERLFTVTGTHVEGARFGAVRPAIVALATSVAEGMTA